MFLLCQLCGEAAKTQDIGSHFCFFNAKKKSVYKVDGTAVLFKTPFPLFCFPVEIAFFKLRFCQPF